MDGDQEEKRENPPAGSTYRGRRWTERLSANWRYTRFTSINRAGLPTIYFRIEPPPGSSDVPEEVQEAFRDLKRLDPVAGHGGRGQPTGLVFKKDKRYGPTWQVRDNPTGRLLAEIVDARMQDLAHKIEDDRPKGR